jgi:hypothetical protein
MMSADSLGLLLCACNNQWIKEAQGLQKNNRYKVIILIEINICKNQGFATSVYKSEPGTGSGLTSPWFVSHESHF